jgi:hypothetical protein
MSKLNRNKIHSSLLLIIFSLLLLISLYGCGTGPDEGTGTGTGTTPTTGSSTITLSISSNTVTFGTPVTATATLRNANGEPLQDAVVSFTATNGLVTFTPTSATALTNASGVASVNLDAASMDSSGATSITASASVTTGGTASTVTTAPIGISINGVAATIQSLTLGSPSISSYGTSSVSALVWLNGAPATVPVSVTFTSSCGSKATLTTPVTTVAGTATSTYTDNNCALGSDVITASVKGDTKTVTITVVPPATNNIQFVSATPAIIGTSTASSALLPTSSLVKFKVVDSSNNGKSGVLVNFTTVPSSPTTLFTLSALSATSDANGEVTTTLSSGTIPTPAWVVATVNGTSIKSQSNTLTITTGLPTQDFFSLSVQTYNIEGWNYDGKTSALTIIASDRLGNPVPDGTVVNFITEGAQITPASCTMKDGACTSTFRSSESRPTDGRVSILAYAIGEKSFVDANITNSHDAGETFYDLGDPYIDKNENSIWDTGEFYIPSTTSGSSACRTQPGAGALPGNYWNALSKENTCTADWGQNYVRRNAVLVLSGSTATITPTTVSMGSSCIKSFDLMLMDVNHNPMPAGSMVTLENQAIYYSSSLTGNSLATINSVGGTPVSNSSTPGGTTVSLTVDGAFNCNGTGTIPYPKGTVNMVITTPNLVKSYILITVN